MKTFHDFIPISDENSIHVQIKIKDEDKKTRLKRGNTRWRRSIEEERIANTPIKIPDFVGESS